MFTEIISQLDIWKTMRVLPLDNFNLLEPKYKLIGWCYPLDYENMLYIRYNKAVRLFYYHVTPIWSTKDKPQPKYSSIKLSFFFAFAYKEHPYFQSQWLHMYRGPFFYHCLFFFFVLFLLFVLFCFSIFLNSDITQLVQERRWHQARLRHAGINVSYSIYLTSVLLSYLWVLVDGAHWASKSGHNLETR